MTAHAAEPSPPGPLDGVTIVEAAYYYATPFATALLAELGARVIKIEPIDGDPYRLLARASGDPVRNLGHNNMVRAMQGKESIALNLKDHRGRGDPPPARRRGRRLRPQLPARRARVARHRRARRCGRSTRASSTTTPRRTGRSVPYSGQPAIDPVIAAFAAARPHYQPGEGNPPLTRDRRRPDRRGRARDGDDARAVRAAPHRRGPVRRVGDDRLQPLSQLRGRACLPRKAAPASSPTPCSSAPAPPIGCTRPARSAIAALAPDENPNPHWVFLAAEGDREFADFCALAGRDDIAADPRFSSAAARELQRCRTFDAAGSGLPDASRAGVGSGGARGRRRLRDGGRHVPLRVPVRRRAIAGGHDDGAAPSTRASAAPTGATPRWSDSRARPARAGRSARKASTPGRSCVSSATTTRRSPS